MNSGWIRLFHPLFALNPTWPSYVVNWSVHPKIYIDRRRHKIEYLIKEITTYVGLNVCYILNDKCLFILVHILVTFHCVRAMSKIKTTICVVCLCLVCKPWHVNGYAYNMWSVRAWVYSMVWLLLPSNTKSINDFMFIV